MTQSNVNRRELLAGASVGAAALLLAENAQAQGAARPIVFARITIITPDATNDDYALAVAGDKIAAIGPSAQVLAQYPNSEIVDGRGKAILPGLINCHAHLTATLERGFNEDFGFPNAAHPALSPTRLLQGDEKTLMAQIGALEAIKSGTTSLVEFASGISTYAPALARSGLRWVFAESVADTANVPAPMSAEGLAKSQPPQYSAQKRDEGMTRISDLYSAWHGKEKGRISVFPTAALAETTSPDLLKAVRAFADKHDLGYSIHLSQSRPEVAFMVKYYELRPPAFLSRHGFLGPRLFAAHCRFVDQSDMTLLGNSQTIISHQAAMAANRAVIPPIPELRAAGCPIANGTDNNTNDMFEVMRIALVTERIARNKDDDPNPGLQPQPEDMLKDATLGGARALNQEKTIGALEVGRKADLIVINTQRPHLVPAGRILSAFIHNGQPSDIESVMVDGAFVMRDRKVLTMDEAALVAEADKVGRRIWGQVKAAGPISIPRLPA
ncbi:MAG TPA: amidohydrolase family protein [Rhizomicrobium sp.]|jgi:cytosine/adenosine deaminase-related metal-dependent hydrolase|nr:amidohydrolase family protein [Rhizomicrobium sp.]